MSSFCLPGCEACKFEQCPFCSYDQFIDSYHWRQQCAYPCRKCSNYKTNCQTYDVGYYLEGNKCKLCSEGCFYCADEKFMLGMLSLIFFTNYECVRFESNCYSCYSQNYCQVGYNLTNSDLDQCQKCNFDQCAICNNASDCKVFQDGYHLDSNTKCLLKTCTRTNCMKCLSDTVCHICLPRLFADSAGQCQFCDVNCRKCLNISNQCTSCSPNYHLESNGTCQFCSTGCLLSSTATICQSCASGYFDIKSDKCSQFCRTCSVNQINAQVATNSQSQIQHVMHKSMF